ncbi:glutathione S-transferase, amine-terminal domain protein (macronuclear) [Tetrahymena thermophila SB210]|uniref:glutathione transferase n=1 Tax=Tetrahymena thermophila (strain SB210) TaxID=312017 RepID=Q23J83_TETTS|nr:glutathione S-transferase, amine-terminal domain protein [Tetrahymena thermophila SB210]EAR96621.1 glutathione S-transferase, amine-terminal domain protein [Tetrahymena thermophila SB210]|eukprot:XP_001016866.1 glutathione S-transferase, amine-terminal domain protein [Tetrahymena thermophila SB210]
MSNNDTLILGYWAQPVRAQPIRYILEIGKYPYKENQYKTPAEWFEKDSMSLGLQFPNLPYIIKGDLKITESHNVAQYAIEVSNQCNLQGTGQQKYKIENVRLVADEVMMKVFGAIKLSGEAQTNEFKTNIIPKLTLLQKHLGNKVYFFDNKLSVADIYTYSGLYILKNKFPEQYQPFAATFDPFIKNFESIPQIKEYQSSDRFPKLR